MALELMENNTPSLSRARFPAIKGPLSWARLGDFVCDAIRTQLSEAQNEDDIALAASHARVLQGRLQARDRIKGARTTRDLRDTINATVALTAGLLEMVRIRSGDLRPDHDNGARAGVIRQRWVRLKLGTSPFVKQLMEQTVARVLAGSASAGVKALFNRALTHWLPPPPAPVDGTTVEWDSDLDD